MADERAEGCEKSALPERIFPMLAVPAAEPFDREGWLFEVKWDGYRAVAEVDGRSVRLYSRRGLSLAERFPSVVAALRDFGHQVVLDGEVVALDDEGRAQFQLLQNYAEGAGHLVYYVFDLLFLDGCDLRDRPLRERKELLRQVLPGRPGLRYSDHLQRQGIAFFNAVRQLEVEGIIAKDGASAYVEGRSFAWRKIKHRRRQEAVIGGFTAPRGGRSGFGALLLGVYQEGRLIYVGHVGSGFSDKALSALHRTLLALATPASPFAARPPSAMPVAWVRPELVCEVEFAEWTGDGLMRHPVFLGLRDDKSPQEVTREDWRGSGDDR